MPNLPSPSRTRRALLALATGTALTAVLAPAATALADTGRGHNGGHGSGHGSGERPPAGLQRAADKLVADGQPGVIMMTRRDGRVAHVTSGVADRATGRPMDARLQFRIASVTKSFTSTVLLQLAAERRVSLDDTVEKWLPGVVRGNGNDGSKITLRQLLQQTGGLNEYVRDPRIMGDPRRTWKPAELVAIAMEQPPRHAPGAGWNYANTNYVLAGMVVEKATGRTFGAELQRRIIGPLKLRHTSLPVESRTFPGPYVHGYWEDFGDVSTEVSPSSGWTSGGIVSTVDDVARFHRALFTGRLLPRAQQRELTTTRPVDDEGIVEDYGLGIARIRFSCGYGWGHDGGWPGYRTWTYTSADGKRQAVVTYNDSSAAMETDPGFRVDLAKAADTAFCA
ncbi:serine hydrolase domain-containing protein [Spirillospora sp. NBC_01491]|uniref:serine hydrolase domain-containing protein n=1 Tax=Spirillospora sp. NBC_01491 TaxID=2976007 RepID=UPI002E3703C3|nr:serine hydrolase domain-containing protein [Spirillospora sp. NBC_01491]